MTVDLETLGEWAGDIAVVLKDHDAPTLKNLYGYVRDHRRKTGRTWKKGNEATVRNVLQRHCRTSDQYQGKHDLFEHLVDGCWRLRPEIKIK